MSAGQRTEDAGLSPDRPSPFCPHGRDAKAPLRGIGVGQVQPNHHIQVGVFRVLPEVRLVFLQKAVHVELVIQPVELAAVRVRGVDVLRGGDEQTAGIAIIAHAFGQCGVARQ